MTVHLLEHNVAISLCSRGWEEYIADVFSIFDVESLLRIQCHTMVSNLSSHLILEEHHITSFSTMCVSVSGHPFLFAIGPIEPVFVYCCSVNGLCESVTFLQCRQQNPRLPGSHKLSPAQSRPKPYRTTFAMQYCQPAASIMVPL